MLSKETISNGIKNKWTNENNATSKLNSYLLTTCLNLTINKLNTVFENIQ